MGGLGGNWVKNESDLVQNMHKRNMLSNILKKNSGKRSTDLESEDPIPLLIHSIEYVVGVAAQVGCKYYRYSLYGGCKGSQTSGGEKFGENCMKSLLVDQPCWTLVLKTPVHPLDLHRTEPEDDKLLDDKSGDEQTL